MLSAKLSISFVIIFFYFENSENIFNDQRHFTILLIMMVSSQKGPSRHAYAWQIGPFWQDTMEIKIPKSLRTAECSLVRLSTSEYTFLVFLTSTQIFVGGCG